jgi:hypothetical protein
MVYILSFFSSKCSLFHNSNVFGSCIIHILYTVCDKIKKKNNSGAKRLLVNFFLLFIFYTKRGVALYRVKANQSHYRLRGAQRVQEVKVPRLSDNGPGRW